MRYNARGTEMNRLPAFGFAMAFFTVILWNSAIGSGITQSAYNLIESSGSPLTMRTTINCGSGLTCVDNAGSNRTDISASGGGGGITALTQDVAASGSGSVAATVQGIDTVPLCSGYAPTNGQFLEYTTGGSPNPCYSSAAGGGSGTFSAASPYLYDGTTYYVAYNGYTATKPPASPSWINSVSPTNFATGGNGDSIISTTGVNWQTQSGTTSVEGDLRVASSQLHTGTHNSEAGIWMYDSTNSKIYDLVCNLPANNSSAPQVNAQILQVNVYTYLGSGDPSFSSTLANYDSPCATSHLKLSKSGSTLTISVSLDGGAVFTALTTQSVGTLAQGGYIVASSGTGLAIADIFSLVVN